MRSEEVRKKVAYDLTMEYVRQNNVMKNPSNDSPISYKIEIIEKMYNEIFEELRVRIFYKLVKVLLNAMYLFLP